MPGWDIISAISYNQNHLPIVKKAMGVGHVSDTMTTEIDRLLKRDNVALQLPRPILIKAPTGSGKSTFVMKDLAQIVRDINVDGRILLLTNRKALCLQQRILANSNSNMPRLGTDALSGNPIWDNIDIISYQEAISYITHDWYNTINQIRVVVCDEAHFFCSDSTFNAHTSEILRLILFKFFWQQRIYMTATPEVVERVITFEEKNQLSFYITQLQLQNQNKWQALQKNHLDQQQLMQGTNGNMQAFLAAQQREIDGLNAELNKDDNYIRTTSCNQKLFLYEYPDDFSHVQLHFVYAWDSLVNAINKDDSEDKWLIFVRSKERGQRLKKELGSCADYFDADSKGDDKTALINLIRREYFEKKVLIATTVLYNGVNFRDDCLKHIVVNTVNQVELVQMLGRKRLSENELVNLYVVVPQKSDLSNYLNLTKRKLHMAKSFQRDPHSFFRNNWESGNIDDSIQKLFGVPSDFIGTSINMSYYAPYELGVEEGQFEACLDEISKDGYLFESRVCKWLHMEYSQEMKFDASREDSKDSIKPDVIKCFEKYKAKSPFLTEAGEAFWEEIYDLVTPIKDSLSFKFKHTNSDGESRWKADINGISEVFDLPYKLDGGFKKGFSVTLKNQKSKKNESISESDANVETTQEAETTENK